MLPSVLVVAMLGGARGPALQVNSPPPTAGTLITFPARERMAGPFLSVLGGSRTGVRLHGPDGSSMELALARNGVVNILHRRVLRVTESYRRCLVVGTAYGVEDEWYLGRGVAVRLELGIGPPLPGSALRAALRLAWYITEAASVEIGYDLTGGPEFALDLHF